MALVAALLIPGLVLAGGGTNKLHADLTGGQVVPAGSGAPAGQGHARITLEPNKGRVCFKINYKKIGPTKGLNAGIYAGVKGSNGDLAATLFKGQRQSPVEGCAPISAANSKDIRKAPRKFNVDI
ncbi:MAG: CHRD domain-containing protein, partial [Candidatus Limnocylindria bacterium]